MGSPSNSASDTSSSGASGSSSRSGSSSSSSGSSGSSRSASPPPKPTADPHKAPQRNGNEVAPAGDHKEKSQPEEAGLTRLVVGNLTRNVTEEHLSEIFSTYGKLAKVELAIDKTVNLPRGFAHVEFEKHSDAQKALDHMHEGQLDGNVIRVAVVAKGLPPPPPRLPSPPPRPGSRDERSSRRPAEAALPRDQARDTGGGRDDRGMDRDRVRSERERMEQDRPDRDRRSRSPLRGPGSDRNMGSRRPSPPPRGSAQGGVAQAAMRSSPRRGVRSSPRRSPGRRRSPSPARRRRSPARSRTPPRVPIANIRNFSIIAHIDHGKSTLADQLLLKTGTVAARDMVEQFMDSNEIERERGITIKLNTARMKYTAEDGQLYALNLIDTPGSTVLLSRSLSLPPHPLHHAFELLPLLCCCAFGLSLLPLLASRPLARILSAPHIPDLTCSYEVSRSLAACEGALLVVDASQGVEAQTLANVWLALESDLEVIPILNKIDLPGAEPERVVKEIEDIIGLDCSNILRVSAKQGVGIEETLEAIVQRVPAPTNTIGQPMRALIFDSYYDIYRGVVCQFKVVDGAVSRGDTVVMMNTGKEYTLDEIGVLAPGKVQVDTLFCGEVGYLAAQIKSVKDARVGDTVTQKKNMAASPLPGYQDVQPMVYCGLFPVETDDYQDLREGLEKLQLNDAALKFEPEVSSAMGFGFRCGFLGLLHMEIVQERLEREWNLALITTAPTVVYQCITTDGRELLINSPAELPEASKRESISEPYVRLEMVTPTEYVGNLMELATGRRGEFVEMKYLTEKRTTLVYNIPLAEVVTDYFDMLKSRTKGYASMEYKVIGYRKNELVKLEVKINGEPAEPLSVVCHRDAAYKLGKQLVSKLKELIPRQMFRVPIQACIGVKVIASEAIAPYRKDVLAKCYGGDISRKKKLLQKQADGKKRMKSLGKVEIPQEAFMAVLKLDKESSDDPWGGTWQQTVARFMTAMTFFISALQLFQSFNQDTGGPLVSALGPNVDRLMLHAQRLTGLTVPGVKSSYSCLQVANSALSVQPFYPRLFLALATTEFLGALLYASDIRFGGWILVYVPVQLGSLAISTPLRHNWWDHIHHPVQLQVQLDQFIKCVGLAGALCYFLATSKGTRHRNKYERWMDQMKADREVKAAQLQAAAQAAPLTAGESKKES
ncbi:hypothetical protein QJQ45_027662 [Haematococcus lacustris]|nr:hypothetical protein QJQ45_027662 [Haematococcus lacustris]